MESDSRTARLRELCPTAYSAGRATTAAATSLCQHPAVIHLVCGGKDFVPRCPFVALWDFLCTPCVDGSTISAAQPSNVAAEVVKKRPKIAQDEKSQSAQYHRPPFFNTADYRNVLISNKADFDLNRRRKYVQKEKSFLCLTRCLFADTAKSQNVFFAERSKS
jgi:hypothetical protein